MCYRHFDHSYTDTNMLVERFEYLLEYSYFIAYRIINDYYCSFHNKLKTNPRYLDKHANRRCDDLIQVLLRIEEDMFHDRKRKEIMGSPSDASLKLEGDERHARGVEIPDSSVTLINDNQYQVRSSESTYTVQILSHCQEQPSCVPQCSKVQCKYLCRHMAQCSCIDYIHGHICKHAHKVIA